MNHDNLSVGNVAVSDMAAEYGTPLYIYDGQHLIDNLQDLRRRLPQRLEIFFSLKANPNLSVYATLHGAGARAEVSSLAELTTALVAGTDPENVIFLGPGKSTEEIETCITTGIYALVVESFEELDLIDEIAGRIGQRARVALRVNPSFSVKGSGLTMGGKPRQFGIDETQLRESTVIGTHANVDVIGVQVYMGTRILDSDVVVANTTRIFELAEALSEIHGFDLEMVDIGGGLGVAYFDNETDLDVDALGRDLSPVINDFAQRHPDTRLIMELGRFLTATSGMYVTRVRYTKTSHEQNFAVTDGGTNHHMAAVGVGSFVRRNFPIQLVSRTAVEPTEAWNVSGPLCTPNDLLAKDAALPPLHRGDLVAVLRSGAYGPSASPGNFLSHGYPAEVLVLDGKAHLVRRPDRTEDLLERQILVRPSLGIGIPA